MAIVHFPVSMGWLANGLRCDFGNSLSSFYIVCKTTHGLLVYGASLFVLLLYIPSQQLWS